MKPPDRGFAVRKPAFPARKWLVALVIASLGIPLAGFAAGQDDPAKPGSPATGKGKLARKAKAARAAQVQQKGLSPERREALEILRDLRQLSDAVLDDAKQPTAEAALSTEALLKKIGRPERVVQTPTLTSQMLDDLILKTLDEAKVAPAKLADDVTFLRRVMIDLTGKAPTPEQVLAFDRESDPKKREKLIDTLLRSKEFGRNWARYWRDAISYHATTTQFRFTNYPEFEDWLATQLVENRPWDEVVREILTATGDTRENGATMMVMAHSDQRFQPVEMAGEVSRVFMGVQIACAQCHDHPTDSWKREQFHEFAAFFSGVQPRRQGRQPDFKVDVMDRPGRSTYQMPDLQDPQKQIPIEPKFFLASSEAKLPRGLNSQQLRAVMASYVTGQDNPWFARSFINRAWYALLGESFYDAVDDLGPERGAEAEGVIDTLADAWAAGGYDIRWLFETIMNTRAYQRQARSTQSAPGRTPFASNCPSRLRSDQILDALVEVLNVPFDAARPPARPAAGADQKKAAAVPEAVQRQLRNRPRNQFNTLFGFDPSIANEDVLGTIPQALFLMNSQQLQRAIEARRNTMLGELLAKYPDNRAAVDALYLEVLARKPNDDEVKTCGEYLGSVGNRREAFEDILWALINSTEFVSRR